MSGIIGKKLGMTALYDERGQQMACTLLSAGPCVVTQLREEAKDGYRATQLAYEERKEKHSSKAMRGHFARASTTPKRKVVEFRNFRYNFERAVALGNTVRVEEVFEENEFIDASAITKGKGFQGVVKRHGFAGVGEATHGQHNRQRAPGAIGACSYPARVFKGLRMAGRMGGKKEKVLNLKVMKIMPKENLIVLRGAVPGPRGGYVVLEK